MLLKIFIKMGTEKEIWVQKKMKLYEISSFKIKKSIFLIPNESILKIFQFLICNYNQYLEDHF